MRYSRENASPDFPCQTAICRSSIYDHMSLIRNVLLKCFSPFTGGSAAAREVQPAEQSESVSSFQLAGNTEQAICKRLQAIARGDAHQVLPAMDAISRGHNIDEALILERIREVGRARPYEAGHLMTRLFARATTETRLEIIKEFVSSPAIGDKHAVGDLFVSLMERSTRDERRGEIYPTLYRIIDTNENLGESVRGKRAFLSALLKGWMSEI